jgi:nitrogenase-stabilizing/protective protein
LATHSIVRAIAAVFGVQRCQSRRPLLIAAVRKPLGGYLLIIGRYSMSLKDDLEELESAEDFLTYFDVDYVQSVVHVNRLHILQRFHDYLKQGAAQMPEDESAQRRVYKTLLISAYSDFVASDAQTEKVFKVFKMNEPQTAFVALSDIQL